jgi:hypothetical protein
MAKLQRTVDEKGDDLAIEQLQHAQMKETRDYVERGRGLASQTDDEVKSVGSRCLKGGSTKRRQRTCAI